MNPVTLYQSVVRNLGSLITYAIVTVVSAGCGNKTPSIQNPMWEIPPFTLTERSGKPFESQSLKGKVWVANFFFTSCPGSCLMISGTMKQLHNKIVSKEGVALVSISADPETDTTEALTKYANQFGADQKWLFLTGKKDAVWGLCRDGFKLPISDAPGAPEPITHSSLILLVDKQGRVRQRYEAVVEPNIDQILTDIDFLIREPIRNQF